MAVRGLNHIALKSRDLKQTEDFYTAVLQLRVAFRHSPDMLFLTTPGGADLINFVKSAARPSGAQGLEHIGFRVTPARLRKIEAALKTRGIRIDGRRGKQAIYFADPNGYQIELYCD
jgi:catechol 2,3-dioxygenase-like lactoylglutathione lyase family enzyme